MQRAAPRCRCALLIHLSLCVSQITAIHCIVHSSVSDTMQSVLDERTGTTEVQGNEVAQKLFAAVTAGDLAQVQQLLPLGDSTSTSTPSSLSVNIADSAGFTPLIIASRLAHVDLVRYLLSLPSIDVNAHTHHYNTAFLYAAAKGHLELVRMLLEHGADFFFTNANNDTALMCATTAGHLETVQFLLDAFHSIQRAKVAHSGGGGVSHKRWVTLKNEEGLTTLMCAAMSGSLPLVRLVLAEARRELAIHMPSMQLVPNGEPSALTQFYPSIWPEVLGTVQFDSHSSGGYVDPAPAAFQAFVNAQNLMGDTALHIAAQNQNIDLFFLLVDNAGADPMRVNRRGQRSFELFAAPDQEATPAATAPAPASDDGSAAATAPAATPSTSASSSAVDVQEALTDHLEKVIEFQRLCRVDYVAQQLSNSEKLFSELMEEEEEQQAAQARRKKPSKAKVELIEKKPKKAKKKAAAPVSAGKSDGATAAAANGQQQSASETSSPSSSPRLAAAASPAAPAATVAAAPSSVSGAATDSSSGDAASGWEVVAPKAAKHAKEKAGGKQTHQQQQHQQQQQQTAHTVATAPSAAAVATAAAATAGVSEKKKAATPGSPKPPRKPKAQSKAAQASSARKEDAPVPASAPAAARTAASSPTFVPAFTLVPSNTPAAPVTAAKQPAAAAAATAAAPAAASAPAAAEPAPSSSFFAAFSSRPRAWRPITALQPRRSPPPTDSVTNAGTSAAAGASSSAASSSSSDDLASLQSQFSTLHPHIESTDLQLSHLLGSDWSGLSMSQLSVLEEVYATLGRQIRDTQFQLFQQQQQEIMSELVRTKSEVHALRKQVDSASATKTDQ